MVPEHLRFGGGVESTILNPVVMVILAITCALILFLPRRKIIVPFLLAVFLIPFDQILVVGGLHFPLLRVLILAGMIRIFIIKGAGEWRTFSGGFNKIDAAVILLAVNVAVAGVLLFHNGQAFIFQSGALYTTLGTYLLLRCLIRDREDFVRSVRTLAFIVLVLGAVMVFEHITRGWNPYALLGGANASTFAAEMIRNGHVRATGSFSQPILAGTFGAVAVFFFITLWVSDKRQRRVAVAGVFGATVMVLASSSSTPLIAYMCGVVALCFWPVRNSMRIVRWGVVLALVCLQMVMTAPVYHIITHLHTGDSYHRFQLIDQCVKHFSSWWLVGTASNASWGWDMWDTANQYVQTADNSGLLPLILLIAIMVLGFKYIGKARRAASDQQQAVFFWALGAAFFAEMVAFLGISLWDQSMVEWYLLLAFIGAVVAPCVRAGRQESGAELEPGMLPVDPEPVYAAWRARGPATRQFSRDRETSREPVRQGVPNSHGSFRYHR
ncbi:MAG TPA: hypothetical protein VJR26_05830 [Candidatus Acidoferrales bacterium]|nr:hypothetical protein [Candidatus Acidoferrales bacterium]